LNMRGGRTISKLSTRKKKLGAPAPAAIRKKMLVAVPKGAPAGDKKGKESVPPWGRGGEKKKKGGLLSEKYNVFEKVGKKRGTGTPGEAPGKPLLKV